MFKQALRKRLFVIALTVGFGCQTSSAWAGGEPTVDQELKEIDQKIDSGRVSKDMVARVQVLIGKQPKSAAGHYTAGRLLAYYGYNDLAEQEFALADQLDPARAKAVLELFDLRVQKEDFIGAYRLLQFIAKRFPDEPSLMMMQGIFLEREGQLAQAERVYEKALANPKKVVGVATALAGVRLRQGKSLEALRLANIDLERSPNHFNANIIKGEALLALDRPGPATVCLEKARLVKPKHSDLPKILALAHYRNKDYQKALPYALLIMATKTKSNELADAKLFCAKLINQLPPATTQICIRGTEGSLIDDIYRSRLHLAVGDVFDRMSRHTEAAEQFKEGVRYDPSNARGWYRLAVDEELFGMYDLALIHFKRAHDLNPSDQEVSAACIRLALRVLNRQRDVAWRLKEWMNSSKT